MSNPGHKLSLVVQAIPELGGEGLNIGPHHRQSQSPTATVGPHLDWPRLLPT